MEYCGANFISGNEAAAGNSNLEPPSEEKIYTIAGIYLACMVTAVIVIAVGVDSLER